MGEELTRNNTDSERARWGMEQEHREQRHRMLDRVLETIREDRLRLLANIDLRVARGLFDSALGGWANRYELMANQARNGRLPAIARLKCMDCCCWQQAEVRRCEITGCALWVRARKGDLGA